MNAMKGIMVGVGMMSLVLISPDVMGQCGGCGVAKKAHAAAPVAAPTAPQAVRYITREKLQEMMAADKDLLVIDVLDAASFAKQHIQGAVNIPLAQLGTEMTGCLAAIPKDRAIVVYCANQKCKASTKAAELLMANGFTNVVDYENGLAEWVGSGLAVGSGEVCPCGKVKGQPGCCAPNAVGCTKEKAAGCKMGQAGGCKMGQAADAAPGENGACMAPVPLPTE
jgi:rhodanese-related sulfurtransferase